MSGHDLHTRQRVLEAAAHLFADRGLRKVTIREICRRSRANVAAVNYHFGDKAALYGEVIELAIEVMRRTNEAARAAAEGAPPERRLREHIRVYIEHLTSNRGKTWLHRLFARELADPTPALDAIVERAIRPRVEYLSSIVRDMIGSDATDAAVFNCVASVQAQCIMMALPNPVGERLGVPVDFSQARIERLADHIADFSVAGIRALGRRHAAEQPKPRRAPRAARRTA